MVPRWSTKKWNIFNSTILFRHSLTIFKSDYSVPIIEECQRILIHPYLVAEFIKSFKEFDRPFISNRLSILMYTLYNHVLPGVTWKNNLWAPDTPNCRDAPVDLLVTLDQTVSSSCLYTPNCYFYVMRETFISSTVVSNIYSQNYNCCSLWTISLKSLSKIEMLPPYFFQSKKSTCNAVCFGLELMIKMICFLNCSTINMSFSFVLKVFLYFLSYSFKIPRYLSSKLEQLPAP